MFWIAYVTLGLAVGLIVGFLNGQKSGYTEGWDHAMEVQRGLHSQRGQKAAATRRAKKVIE